MKNLLLATAILCCFDAFSQASSDSANFYFNKGELEKTARRMLLANEAFAKAIAFNPQYTEAYLANAQVLLDMRRTDKALQNFTKLHELQPANKEAIKELMELSFNYRQYDKAIAFAKKCADCPEADRITGMSFYQQEDYAQAEKFLLSAIKKNSNETKPVRSSILNHNNNDYKNAVTAFEKAAASGFEQKNDFNENMGYASLYAGDYSKGEKLLLDILKRKPNNTVLLRDMSEIFYQQKQYDKSLEYCQKLMQIDAKDGKALYQAGLCFQKKGEKDRGQQMCDKAIEMDPSLANLKRKKEMPGM